MASTAEHRSDDSASTPARTKRPAGVLPRLLAGALLCGALSSGLVLPGGASADQAAPADTTDNVLAAALDPQDLPLDVTPEEQVALLTETIAAMEAERLAVEAEREALRREVVELNRRLAENDAETRAQGWREAALEAEISTLADEQAWLADRARRSTQETIDLRRELAEARNLNEVLTGQIDDLVSSVGQRDAGVAALIAERERLRSRLADAAQRYEEAQARNAETEQRLREASAMAVQLASEKELLAARNGDLLGRIAHMQADMQALHAHQETVFAALRQSADQVVEGLTAGLAVTGLDIDELLSESGEAIGGPLVPLVPEVLAARPGWGDASLAVELGVRAEQLREAAARLPLAPPVVDEHRLSSPFGPRSDPFRRSRAMHQGLDFAAPTGTPIYASGPGIVTHAGPMGSYGNLVELDHGGGLTTRFAHMSEVSVAVGQEVDYLDLLGAVGSTGRSTGPHLHYEVRFHGAPFDPAGFLEAGNLLLTTVEE